MEPKRRVWILWVAGGVAVLAALLLVLAFVPLMKCPDHHHVLWGREGKSESASAWSHQPVCATCGGRDKIPVLRGLRICRTCGGSGRESTWGFMFSGETTKCSWCDGTGKHQFRLP